MEGKIKARETRPLERVPRMQDEVCAVGAGWADYKESRSRDSRRVGWISPSRSLEEM